MKIIGEPNHPSVLNTLTTRMCEESIKKLVLYVQQNYPINKMIYVDITYRKSHSIHATAYTSSCDTARISINWNGMNMRTVLHELAHIIVGSEHGHDCIFQYEFIKLCEWIQGKRNIQ